MTPRSARPGMDATLAALADPTRRGAVELLRVRSRRAGELARALRRSAPVMSRHLRVLRTSGLVEDERVERDSRLRIYRLRREPFAELAGWIGRVEEFWGGQLAAFKAHAEGAPKRGGR